MVSAKYRKTDFVKGVDKCKEWFERETKPVLFGMKQCTSYKTLVITEGQLDSLTIDECGIPNAVSVPNGARGFTWVEHCYNWVSRFEEIIVFGDCEKGHITLVDEIARKFVKKKIKVVRQVDYLGEKDANDIYRKYGKAAILTAIGNAQLRPVESIKCLDMVERVNLSEMPKIKTGIFELDKAIGGIYLGQVVLLTGRRGEGKSTLGSMVFKSALEQGFSCFAYSGELPDFHFKSWLDLQIAGSQNVKARTNEYGDKYYVIDDTAEEIINEWYRGRAYLYDNNAIYATEDMEVKEQATLINTIERVARQYDVKFILLDNLMTAIDVAEAEELYNSQREFVKKVKQLASKLDIAILLIAHQKKENKDLDNVTVAGTGDITNLVDVVITYSQNEDKATNDVFKSLIGVTKNRLTGIILKNQNRIKVKYSSRTKRIACAKDDIDRLSSCFLKNSLDEYVDITANDDLGKAVDKYTFTL